MSDPRKDGGQAFPLNVADNVFEGHYKPGMSLRDYFAGQAMIGLSMSWGITRVDSVQFPKAAASCYEIADAMLAERSNP